MNIADKLAAPRIRLSTQCFQVMSLDETYMALKDWALARALDLAQAGFQVVDQALVDTTSAQEPP